ncbi:hypothetical protein AGLY_007736, partial [Aphis glycines]
MYCYPVLARKSFIQYKDNKQLNTSYCSALLLFCYPLRNSDGMYHMKILIPCITAGAIIGKGGETIAQLQTETNTKIKMSKTNDFYPGTTERVCIISGSSSEHIMAALTFIMERIREKPDASNRVQNSGDAIADREKQVKILIPNSTAGMIIGKAGAYIKQLKEDSGCFVQISQKAKDTTLQERCITVSGNTEGNKKVCLCILNKIIEDPLSASCPNLSYADVNGPVANFNPTGSPYALATTNCSNNQTSYNLNATSLSAQDAQRTQPEQHNRTDQPDQHPAAGAVGAAPQRHRAPEHGDQRPVRPGPGRRSDFHQRDPVAKRGQPDAVQRQLLWAGRGGRRGRRCRCRVHAQGDRADDERGAAAAAAAAAALYEMTADDQQSVVKREMDVPESIVGAIIGPGGRSLVEIQQMSGVTIHISKKGVYAPGTTNRKVTICGSASGIAMANYLMQQRIVDEETKRARAPAPFNKTISVRYLIVHVIVREVKPVAAVDSCSTFHLVEFATHAYLFVPSKTYARKEEDLLIICSTDPNKAYREIIMSKIYGIGTEIKMHYVVT